jgi:DNA invertase Pin-like site-specific DNA recombinase
MLEQLRPADEVIVSDVDRLWRTTLELVVLIETWNQKGLFSKSTSQPLIGTTTAHGEFIFQLFPIFSQHERKKLICRTNAGREAARARPRIGGRKKGLSARYEKNKPLVVNAYK